MIDPAAFRMFVSDAIHHGILSWDIFVIDILSMIDFIGQHGLGGDVSCAHYLTDRLGIIKLHQTVLETI
jgi:hypothetical protein